MNVLAVVLVVLVLLVLYAARSAYRRRHTLQRRLPDVTDVTQQLGFVSRVVFERTPLLNKSEFQVFLLLEQVVREVGGGHRVMAQTPLGEILKPKGAGYKELDLAFRSINSKRVDFVIVDRAGFAVVGVEYQGNGHYQGTAALRDAVKREAFRSAGVPLIEVFAAFDRREVATRVRAAIAGRG